MLPGISLPTIDAETEVVEGDEGSSADGVIQNDGDEEGSANSGPAVEGDVDAGYVEAINAEAPALLSVHKSSTDNAEGPADVPVVDGTVDFFDDLEGANLTDLEEYQLLKDKARLRISDNV